MISSRRDGPAAGAAARRRPRSAGSRRQRDDDRFLLQIVRGMRNGVLAIRRDLTVTLINEEACRIFGVAAGAPVAGLPVAAVLREHPDILRLLTAAFELHHLPNRAEMRLRPSDTVIGYTLSLVRDETGEVLGASMFFKDLTRVEQLEERERLRDRLAALGEMAAMFAHEVKNPLAGIEVMAGLLRRKIAGLPEAQQVLTDIIAEVKMANAIVQEVLAFVRPIRLQVEHTAVHEAVRAAIALADRKAARGGVEVVVDIDTALPLIQADPQQLTQVFTNLLANAYEALGGRGRLRITGAPHRMPDGGDGRDAVLLEFSDDGPGMRPEVADKVFNPFFTTKSQGSGLGLAIVRQIVDAHDGRIDLRTVEGQGTTVRVLLPVAASDPL